MSYTHVNMWHIRRAVSVIAYGHSDICFCNTFEVEKSYLYAFS